eukprot:Colp12_sorted_trinity150504_noHs@34235
MIRPTKILFKIFTWYVAAFWACLIIFKMGLVFLKKGPKMFHTKPRPVPPEILTDKSLGEHGYANANGIKFHYVQKGDGPLVLLLHGFPEFWYSWRFQLKGLSAKNKVVAVDLRGYGETSRPKGKNEYAMEKLVADIAALIPALGYRKCTLIGHDWGGLIAWNVANTHPNLLERLVIMNLPHPKTFQMSLKQFLASWYIFFFQLPLLPEIMLLSEDYKFASLAFRGKKGGVVNKDTFTNEDVEAYKWALSRSGTLTSVINYYRNMFDNHTKWRPISVPTLLIHGVNDYFIDSQIVEAAKQHVTNIEIVKIPNCSHWVQNDAHAKVNQLVLKFLGHKA